MIEYFIYGKIIADTIRLLDGTVVHDCLGGGGPQAAFGLGIWNASTALSSRVGKDFSQNLADQLDGLDIDTSFIVRVPEIDTLQGFMSYDENDYVAARNDRDQERIDKLYADFASMLRYDVELSAGGQFPSACHLITEYFTENAVSQALEMKKHGTVLSLEPLVDYRNWTNKHALIDFLPQVDVVSPDWPSAIGFAESSDPVEVLRWWSRCGAACVAVRHGRNGSYVWDSIHDTIWNIPIIDVPRVDPTGCGNSYAGGLCVGWTQNKDAKYAGAMGTVSAALMVGEAGLPRMTEEKHRLAEEYLDRLTVSIRKM